MKLKRILKIVLFILPFILGTIGLYIADYSITDSLFDAFAMYFFCYGDGAFNILIEIARWLAPVVMISSVLTTLSRAWNEIRNHNKIRVKNASAIYCSEENKEQYLEVFPNAVFCGNEYRKDAKKHILMLDTDKENIDLAAKIKDGDVYVELKNTDSFLMKSTERHFFNINEMTARQYWKKFDLMDEQYWNADNGHAMECRIAVIGSGALAVSILKFGLMYNIYDLDQKIDYFCYGLKEDDCTFTETGNCDTVTFCDDVNDDLYACDIAIFTEDVDVKILEKLLYRNIKTKIYYYGTTAYLENVYASGNIFCFGDDILSEKSVMTTDLYRDAMRMNYNYKCLYEGFNPDDPDKEALMEKYYNELSGFLKGSNITSCDYNEIRKKILKRDGNPEIVQDDKYVQMEHLRWCRFYWVNHWKHGTPKNKQERDALRIHTCLVPYEELSREDKDKDLETINVVMKSTC